MKINILKNLVLIILICKVNISYCKDNYFNNHAMKTIFTEIILPQLNPLDLASFGQVNKYCNEIIKESYVKTKKNNLLTNYNNGMEGKNIKEDFYHPLSFSFYTSLLSFVKPRLKNLLTQQGLTNFLRNIAFIIYTFNEQLTSKNKKSAEYLSGTLAANIAFILIEEGHTSDNFLDVLYEMAKSDKYSNLKNWDKFSLNKDDASKFLETIYNDFDKLFKEEDLNKHKRIHHFNSSKAFTELLVRQESYKEIKDAPSLNHYVMPGMTMILKILIKLENLRMGKK